MAHITIRTARNQDGKYIIEVDVTRKGDQALLDVSSYNDFETVEAYLSAALDGVLSEDLEDLGCDDVQVTNEEVAE